MESWKTTDGHAMFHLKQQQQNKNSGTFKHIKQRLMYTKKHKFFLLLLMNNITFVRH